MGDGLEQCCRCAGSRCVGGRWERLSRLGRHRLRLRRLALSRCLLLDQRIRVLAGSLLDHSWILFDNAGFPSTIGPDRLPERGVRLDTLLGSRGCSGRMLLLMVSVDVVVDGRTGIGS